MRNSNSPNILVVGATGFLGMEICRQLTAAGKNVSGLIRKSSAVEKTNALKQWGVQTIIGDLKEMASLTNALQGVDTVISTASSTLSRAEGDSIQTVDNEGQSNLVDAAISAGAKQFVFVSFTFNASEFPLQAAKRRAEKKIMESKMTYTILKPSFFMEAWLSPAVGFDFPNAKATIYGDGTNKISWIAIQDVAAFAVAAVDNPSMKNKIIEVGGPEALGPKEVVDIFQKSLNKSFELQFIPLVALEAQLSAAPDDMSKTFAGLMLFYAAGHDVDMTEKQKLVAVKMKSVKEHAAQMRMMLQPA